VERKTQKVINSSGIVQEGAGEKEKCFALRKKERALGEGLNTNDRRFPSEGKAKQEA